MMTAIECPTSNELKALTLGQLPGDESDALFHHVSECDRCRAMLETVEDTGDSLIASLRSPELDSEFSGEPNCQMAMAKALGALATAELSQSAAELPQLPSSIGEYEIVRPIGRGGMGSVYLARHTKLGRKVALKVLASHRLSDARMRDRFAAEMLAIGRLSHPNIVTAHDARDVNGTAVLVTEFVSGMDLEQLLQRTGPLAIADACEIAKQIAVALCYTHEQGFVHRDIKPSNVMLSERGEVKLLDLGLARLQYGENSGAEITGTGQAMGTADYVAPEQVTDSKTVDIRADNYALGCTLFKLLTGRAPFADDQHITAFAKMTAHVSEAPPSLIELQPDAPRGLVSLIDSMLAKAPSDRPQTPKQIVDGIAPYCQGHELVILSQQAAKLEPKSYTNSPGASTSKPVTQPWMRRKVPTSVAIAAGFFGVLLGMCLSIIIIITNPDGTKSILRLAEGSSVELKEADGDSRKDTTPENSGGITPRQVESKTSGTSTSGEKLPMSDKSFNGVWRVVEADDKGQALTRGQRFESAIAFHNGQFAAFSEKQLKSFGQIEVRSTNSAPDTLDYPQYKLRTPLEDDVEIGSCYFAGPDRIRIQSDSSEYALLRIGSDEAAWLEEPAKSMVAAAFKALSLLQQGKPLELPRLMRLKLNLREVGLAFHNYHDAYGKFPGTVMTLDGDRSPVDGKTQPYSWRVAILPWIGQVELYTTYRFDEPWDSQNNLKLLDKMPEIYRSPYAGADQPPGETNIMGFAGEHTALGTAAGHSINEFTDGLSNTLLVIETLSTVPWTKPTDIPGDATVVFNDHPLIYLLADGTVQSMEKLERQKLNAMITRDGGEVNVGSISP